MRIEVENVLVFRTPRRVNVTLKRDDGSSVEYTIKKERKNFLHEAVSINFKNPEEKMHMDHPFLIKVVEVGEYYKKWLMGNDKKLPMHYVEFARRNNAREQLKKLFEQDVHVYTLLRHVSSTKMVRDIELFIARENKIVNITWYACALMGLKRQDNGGIRMNGCGQDMGHALVYELSCLLFCPDKYEHEAAYKLKQEWL